MRTHWKRQATIDRLLDELLSAKNELAALTVLCRLFAGELDFRSENHSVPLHRAEPPISASCYCLAR